MDNVVDEEQYDDLLDRVAQWQSVWSETSHPTLTYRKAFSSIVIEDRRRRKAANYSYADAHAELYEYCADARTERDIAGAFGSEAWVAEALREFVDNDLMLFLDARYLSLALPQNRNFELTPGPQRLAELPLGGEPVRELVTITG